MTGGDAATSEAIPCMACGRLLSDEESKRLRLGPRCRRRLMGLLAPRPRRRRRLQYPPNHPRATPPPAAPGPVALELWDDDEDEGDDQADEFGSYKIRDVPLTGSYL